jgi:hypothetical protein
MANNITRMPRQQMMQQQAVPGQQWWPGMPWWGDGNPCDDGGGQIPGCPPGFPPPGCPPWWSGQNSPPWYPGANAGVSFGQTPPANPVRGHFFYDGTTLWIFDGAAWETVGGPGAAPSTPPSTTAPVNPQPGQQWFNGTTLYVYDGQAWVPVSQTKTTIQATAPAAPNPGDLWFDGTQMRIWDGSAWQMVGPGATVGPVPTTTQAFAITQPTDIAMTANTWTIVPFATTPLLDTMHGFDPATKKYKPTKAGVYIFFTRSWNTGVAGGTNISLVKNDSGTFTGGQSDTVVAVAGSTAVANYLSASGITTMNGTSDFVRLWAYEGSGTFYNSGQNPIITAWQMV